MNIGETVKAMRAAGVSDSQIVETVLTIEEERLAKLRARVAKCRNNKKDGNVTPVTSVTSVTPPYSPPEPPPITPHFALSNDKDAGASRKQPNGNGLGVPSSDPERDELWRRGPTMLEGLGIPNAKARSCIGRWLKKAKPIDVLAGIEGAVAAKTGDPVPYITTILKDDKPVRKLDNGAWMIRPGCDEWNAWREFRRRNREEGEIYSMDYRQKRNEPMEFRSRWPSVL